MKNIALITICLVLVGCSRTGFEKFAYEACLAEGKHPESLCSCNAASLDKKLTDEEKKILKKATVGDHRSVLALIDMQDKLREIAVKCVE